MEWVVDLMKIRYTSTYYSSIIYYMETMVGSNLKET